MTTVYIFSAKEAQKIPLSYAKKYFPNRLERANRLTDAQDRLLCIGAGALLSKVLSGNETDILSGTYGKPYLENEGLSFNLSHSGRYVLLATDENDVGVDIQEMTDIRKNVYEKCFLPEEHSFIQVDPIPRFFALWTLKESVAKLFGLGLSLPFSSFSVLPLLHGENIAIKGITLYAKSFVYDKHAVSVCAVHPLDKINTVTLTAEKILSR